MGIWLIPCMLMCREIGDKASYIGSHSVMKSRQPEVRSLDCATLMHDAILREKLGLASTNLLASGQSKPYRQYHVYAELCEEEAG